MIPPLKNQRRRILKKGQTITGAKEVTLLQTSKEPTEART